MDSLLHSQPQIIQSTIPRRKKNSSMAVTPFLLESSNIKWRPLLHATFPIKPTNNLIIKTSSSSIRFPKPPLFSNSNLRLNCIFMPQKSFVTQEEENEEEIVTNPFEAVLKALKKPAIAGLLLGLLLFWDPTSPAALAASGGRMGGNSFSSSSSSSSASSYSSGPSYYTRGGGGVSYAVSYYDGGGNVFVGSAVEVASTFIFIIMGFAAFTLMSAFLSDKSDDGGGVFTATGKTSVLKLQVGLLGMARSLQSDLNRIAETADTSNSEGLSYVLTETALALLRHPDYCISGYSSIDVKRNMDEGEKRFNQLSIEERGKFDEETLVNVNNIRKQSSSSQKAKGFSNEYIVITILVAAEGVYKLPTINSSEDLKEALQKLGSIPSRKTLAVEVLWTPQNENDTLTERELLEDYSLLRPL